jgi:hypothetical protein
MPSMNCAFCHDDACEFDADDTLLGLPYEARARHEIYGERVAALNRVLVALPANERPSWRFLDHLRRSMGL